MGKKGVPDGLIHPLSQASFHIHLSHNFCIPDPWLGGEGKINRDKVKRKRKVEENRKNSKRNSAK